MDETDFPDPYRTGERGPTFQYPECLIMFIAVLSVKWPWKFFFNQYPPVLGCFMWMADSGNEAKRMWCETGNLKGGVDYVSMDSKADSYPLFREFALQRSMTLVTSSRRKKQQERKSYQYASVNADTKA